MHFLLLQRRASAAVFSSTLRKMTSAVGSSVTLLPQSQNVPPELSARAVAALASLADKHNVKILFAVESGSRAWGMHSADSDLDVRGVFVRPPKIVSAEGENSHDKAGTGIRSAGRSDADDAQASMEALAVAALKGRDITGRSDEISWFSEDRLIDVSLWSLDKALSLALGGNTTTAEWAQSPHVYCATPGWPSALLTLLPASVPRLTKHFFGCLVSFLRQVDRDERADNPPVRALHALGDKAVSAVMAYKRGAVYGELDRCDAARVALLALLAEMDARGAEVGTAVTITAKKVCYCVRPALALEWLAQRGTPPPSDTPTVLAGLALEDGLRGRLERLLAAKRDEVEAASWAVRDAAVFVWLGEVRVRAAAAIEAAARADAAAFALPTDGEILALRRAAHLVAAAPSDATSVLAQAGEADPAGRLVGQ